ncbi:MAG: hypothetical protein ABEI99_11280, partial [Halobaculum sp.]
GQSGTPETLWRRFHDCGHATCGIVGDEWTECDAAFESFTEQYAVPVPRWWLNSEESPVDSVAELQLNGTVITGSRQIDLEYESRFGIEN